jgi:hypothetical protein
VYLISNKNVSLPLLQILHKQRSQERERLHEVLFGIPEVVEILFLRIDVWQFQDDLSLLSDLREIWSEKNVNSLLI